MKVMGLREFLRGGYRTLKETTVITSHGHTVATWIPNGAAERPVKITYRKADPVFIDENL